MKITKILLKQQQQQQETNKQTNKQNKTQCLCVNSGNTVSISGNVCYISKKLC